MGLRLHFVRRSLKSWHPRSVGVAPYQTPIARSAIGFIMGIVFKHSLNTMGLRLVYNHFVYIGYIRKLRG
jgi:hypothetical protein